MLNWLRRKLINHQRAIFTYWDGQRIVKDDPMRLFRDLLTHPDFDWSTHPQLIDDFGKSKQSHEDREIVLRAVCDVFRVQEFDPLTGKGLLEEELINLLWTFTVYCDSKKKNINPSPTPPPSSDQASSEPSGESDTKPPSDSGSTSAEPKCDMPVA